MGIILRYCRPTAGRRRRSKSGRQVQWDIKVVITARLSCLILSWPKITENVKGGKLSCLVTWMVYDPCSAGVRTKGHTCNCPKSTWMLHYRLHLASNLHTVISSSFEYTFHITGKALSKKSHNLSGVNTVLTANPCYSVLYCISVDSIHPSH